MLTRQDRPLFGALILLGLSVLAVWALTSLSHPPHEQCAQYASDHQAYKECVEIISAETVAEYTKWLAGFTAVLAFFTVLLAGAGFWQGRLTRDSINLARDEFLATHRPKVKILSVYSREEWAADDEGRLDTAMSDVTIMIRFVNAGRSDAIIHEITACVLDEAPTEEALAIRGQDMKNAVLKVGWEGTHLVMTCRLRRGELFQQATWCVGSISYKDSAGRWRKTGCCWVTTPEGEWRRQVNSPFDKSY